MTDNGSSTSSAAGRGGGVSSGPYMPPVTVRVAEGTTIIHDDVSYTGGDTLELPMRTAEHLIIADQVEVVV